MLRKAIFSLVAVLAMGAVALPSQAATQLSWNDISSQLTTRTNRPVWAMAYANGSWFYTDGQDLWNGGQVYRYDGYTQTNITVFGGPGGISRIDDIVSDGQSVLFLKNVTARNNSIEAVIRNTDGGYTNVTWNIRQSLSSDEGIASIVGKNGSWMIVTTYGRVLSWNGTTSNPTSVFSSTSAYTGNIAYSVRHVSPSDENVYLPIATVPTSDGWLISIRESSGNTRFWKRSSNGNLTDVTSAFGAVSVVMTAASNGSNALIAVNNNGSTSANRVLSYDGYTVRDMTSTFSVIPTNSWYRTMTAWNGSNWLLIAWNKDMYTFDGSSVTSLGRAQDFIVTFAGNTNKMFLVGGAESTQNSSSPNFPLNAKLLKATEDIYGSSNNNNNGTSYGTGQTATSANGPTLTSSGNPSDFRVGNGGTFIYRASASDTNGVDRIDLYANGVRIKTCYSDVCDFETQYYTNGQTSRTVPFSARATDRLGYSTDLPRQDILTIDQSSASASNNSNNNNNNTQTGNGISAWSWLDPNQSSIRRDQTATFNIGAWASTGLSKIEIVVNGTVRRTCDYSTAYGNQTCGYTMYGGDYGVGTTVSMNAKVTAANGQTSWTSLTNVNITDTNGSNNNNNNNQNNNTSVWAWSSPETMEIKTNASASYNVTANDVDGIQKIEMYVNGSIKNTCNFGTAYGNRDCSVTINGSSYSAGSDIYVNAKITDSYGNVTWSNARNYHIVAAQTSTPSTTAPTSWIWTTGSVTTLSQNQTATFNVGAWDADGISRIDIWVNGQVKKSCNLGAAYGNQECAYIVRANDYPAGTSVFVNAMIADTQGQITWSDSKSYGITSSVQNNSNNNSSSNLPGSIQVSSNRDSGYKNGQTITFTASAADQNGIDRIELYVNGARVKTCYNTASCSWTGGPYNARNYVNYGATIVDKSGYAIWTGYKAIAKI